MSDGFGWVSPVISPHLERVLREERLQRDPPRKQQEGGQGRSRDDSRREIPDPACKEESMTSASSTHIDLRI